MEAIKGFIEWIGDLLSSLVDSVMTIGQFFMGTIETIKTVLAVPSAAFDVISKLEDYFPVYVWAPLFALITLVLLFRILKIVLSGG